MDRSDRWFFWHVHTQSALASVEERVRRASKPVSVESPDCVGRRVLVNFESMGFAESVIVAADAPDELKDRVLAALLSFQMRVKSVDWVRKAYVDKSRRRRPGNDTWNIQAQIYRASAELLDRTFKELDSHRGEPTLGEYAASIVLERLRSSFFAAHMLYRLGRIIEAHAVSRFILEHSPMSFTTRC
ncbi:MAG: hypothetical protein JWM53_1186 [bacterium]|nr:hypothetical protein [bacterium]